MKLVVHNNDNLKENEINEKIYRSRGLIINSNNEILLGYCKNTYQFPGGYLEDGETIKECLKREIKEETGIKINVLDEPFYRIKNYNKNWPQKGINRYTEFNYFIIKTEEKYDLEKTNFDESEKKFNFELRYISLDKFEETLNNSTNENPKNKIVYSEMIDVYKTYQKINKM